MEPHSRPDRDDYLCRICRPSLRRALFRMARRTHRSSQRAADHCRCFHINGFCLPICMEWLLHDGISVLSGNWHRCEVPVASAYMNEFVSAKRRGRFFLLYEVLFLFGLLSAGLIGYFLIPIYGWRAMFVVGLVPAILTIPMRWFMVESPRWLLSAGRIQKASDIVARMENGLQRRGIALEVP